MSEPVIRFRKEDGSQYPDWTTVQLRDISTRITRRNKDNETDLPLTIASVEGLIDQRTYFGKTVASKDMSGYFLIKKGEYAYNRSCSAGYDFGSIKRLNNYEQGALSTLYLCFALNEGENSDYMQCYFNSLCWYDQMSSICAEGARNHGLLNVSPEDFFSLKICKPSDDEEKEKVAGFIGLIEKYIADIQCELDNWKEIKKGMLQKMFPKEGESVPESRFPEFTDPWEQRKLSMTNTFFTDGNYGEAYPKSSDMTNSNEGIPFLTGGNIKDGKLDVKGANYITKEKHAQLISGHLEEDDIVISVRGSLGSLGYVNKENVGWNINSQLAILRTDKSELYGKFLLQFLLSYVGHNELLKRQTGSALKQLPIGAIKDVVIPITSIAEQRKIGEFLQRLDNIITFYQHESEKWKELKKGLLQQMFVA